MPARRGRARGTSARLSLDRRTARPPATVLVALYEEPEKPSNALDFLKMTLGAPTGVDVEALKAENDQLREKNDQLTQRIMELTKKVRSAPRPPPASPRLRRAAPWRSAHAADPADHHFGPPPSLAIAQIESLTGAPAAAE